MDPAEAQQSVGPHLRSKLVDTQIIYHICFCKNIVLLQILKTSKVTVRDKCPQINVQFKWHTFLKKTKKIRTDGQTDERTDGRTVQLYYAPNFIWGHNKKNSPIRSR